MSGYKLLKDAANRFEEEIRHVSAGLFSAKIRQSFEDGLAKKLQDLSVITSKLRLLRAKPSSLSLEIAEHEKDEVTVISDYGEVAALKVIEQQLVKSATQAQAVKALITAPNCTLDPEMVERKENIIKQLSEYRNQESTLQHLNKMLKEAEDNLAEVQATWDREVTELKKMTEGRTESEGDEESGGPLYRKTRKCVDKIEMVRWLISALATGRVGRYDWMTDPDRRLPGLRLARKHPEQVLGTRL